MINAVSKNRYFIFRRTIQIGLLLLFGGANWWGWKIVNGDYSAAYVLEWFYLADPHAVLQTFLAGFVLSSDAIFGGIIVLSFYALIAGRSFCSWVCPVNLITDTATTARKKWQLTKKEGFLGISRKTRFWVLGLGLILSAVVGVAAFEVVNPITMLHRGVIFGFGMGWTAIAAIFLFDLFVVEHGWCGHVCPLGAFYTLTGRFALIKIKHNSDKCTLCGKCFAVCPEKQVLNIIGKKSGFIRGACTDCGRCVEVCEDKALKFSIDNYKNIGVKNNE